MDREEKRIDAAIKYANAATGGIDDDGYFDIVMKTHLDATNWADENPCKELVSIDKACEWVSTKESLPPLDKNVLVVLPECTITIARREKSRTTEYQEKWVGDSGCVYLDQLVYYWKDLPEPPKMEG